MVKIIMFDLQGTLVENGVYPSPIKQVKAILRINAPFSDFVMRFENAFVTKQHPSLKDAFIAVCEEFQILPKEYIIDKLVGLWNTNKLLAKMYPDVIPALTELKSKYKLVLVANIDCFSKDMVERFKLNEYFDKILLSCDAGLLKNNKEFYTSMIEEYGLPPEDMVMVGDSIESDMNTARDLGIKGILVDRKNRREFTPKVLLLTELSEKILE